MPTPTLTLANWVGGFLLGYQDFQTRPCLYLKQQQTHRQRAYTRGPEAIIQILLYRLHAACESSTRPPEGTITKGASFF